MGLYIYTHTRIWLCPISSGGLWGFLIFWDLHLDNAVPRGLKLGERVALALSNTQRVEWAGIRNLWFPELQISWPRPEHICWICWKESKSNGFNPDISRPILLFQAMLQSSTIYSGSCLGHCYPAVKQQPAKHRRPISPRRIWALSAARRVPWARDLTRYVDRFDSLKIFQLSENPAWFRILWSKMLQNQRFYMFQIKSSSIQHDLWKTAIRSQVWHSFSVWPTFICRVLA